MYVRKAQAGGAPGYTWTHDGQVLDVEDDLAIQLLNIPGGGFSEVGPEDFDADFEDGEPVEIVTDEPPKKKGGRPRLPRDEHGNIIRTEIAETE